MCKYGRVKGVLLLFFSPSIVEARKIYFNENKRRQNLLCTIEKDIAKLDKILLLILLL
jgi:hypothetical protein